MARNYVDSNSVYLNDECRRLYLAALNGDWNSVKNMKDIQRKITVIGETTLHIAAAANQEKFVRNLLGMMDSESLAAENDARNTALTYAAATGNVNIAKAMLNKNHELPNLDSGIKPLHMAASLGHRQMVKLLYSKTKKVVSGWVEDEQAKLFISCVEREIYGVALKMLKANSNLATRDSRGKNALHVLARNPSAFVSETRPWLKLKQENSKQSQANELFKNCLLAYKGKGNVEYSSVIPLVLFDAAEAGNIECLIKLIRFDFDLLWKTKSGTRKTIFHVAVEKRHENIFNLLNELGSIGGLIINQGGGEDGSNILHLAAGLAPQEKLNDISGAALQMQREISWFKEVEKVVPPEFKETKKKNKENKEMKKEDEEWETPYVLFARTHEELRTKAEKWMTDTANYSMVVATLIGSILFGGLIADIDGSDNYPNLYLAFSVASAIALFCSSTSLVIFLSILTSRYSFEDFLVLPLRLMIGIATLFISIAAMMVAFSTSFWLKNLHHKKFPVIIVFIGLLGSVPILLYVLLKWRLFVDIARSTFPCKPRHRLLYKEVSRPATPANCTPQELELASV